MVGGRFGGDGSEFASGILTAADVETVAGVDGVLEVHPILHVNPLYVEHDTGKYELTINANIQMITPDQDVGSPMPEGGNHVLLTRAYLVSLSFSDAEPAVGQPVTIGIADQSGEVHELGATISGV